MQKTALLTSEKLKTFRSHILRWGKTNVRYFPWRKTRDPYKILIAEIMLRRTKADQVVPVYNEFISRFPSLTDFETANCNSLRKLLKPLGLVWRCENIIELSRFLKSRSIKRLEDLKDALKTLPGVGEYVANAVLCFGFRKRIEIIDVNIVRVISRVIGRQYYSESRRDQALVKIIRTALPTKNVQLYNYALLDLGASICFAVKPDHNHCPVRTICSHFKKVGVSS